ASRNERIYGRSKMRYGANYNDRQSAGAMTHRGGLSRRRCLLASKASLAVICWHLAIGSAVSLEKPSALGSCRATKRSHTRIGLSNFECANVRSLNNTGDTS